MNTSILIEGEGWWLSRQDQVEAAFYVLSAAAGLLTTDFDFTNAASFEFVLATTINNKRSGHD